MIESPEERRRIQLYLKASLLDQVDGLKKEWGSRNRGEVFERLLEEVFGGQDQDAEGGANRHEANEAEHQLDEGLALMLVGPRALLSKQHDTAPADPSTAEQLSRRRGGIDLPGFVQRNTQQLRRSFRSNATTEPGISSVPAIPMDLLRQAQSGDGAAAPSGLWRLRRGDAADQ